MTLSEIIALYLLIFFVGVAAGAVVIIAVEYEWSVKSLLNKLKPERSTPLQREIKAEWKEIDKLKQHKRDMEELEELKKQKDRLWEEVHEEECSTFKGIDPLPHLKNLQAHPNNIVEECPYCQGDNFWLEYTKDKLIQSCKECDAPVAFIKQGG